MKKIKIGVFGCDRGAAYYDSILINNGEIVAVCDFNEEKMLASVKHLTDKPACYTDFEEFFKHDMDAVFLANYFHEHAQYAIRFLEKGVHVLSECITNATMAEGVALVRAAEKSSAFYMLAENYPFMNCNQEMRRVYRSGNLGKFLYGEGEYNHPTNNMSSSTLALRPFEKHWRNHTPRTYYVTHSLAPLMYVTGATPKRVTAMPVFAPIDETECDRLAMHYGDRAAIITCLNDDDSVYRFTGCSDFGGHHCSYRICGTKGQIENPRGGNGKVMLRYNDWEIPEGEDEQRYYDPEWPADLKELIEKTGHGGSDFFVMNEFFSCIREGRRPEFDEYFGTTCSSVAILGFRSMKEKGVPYDIPDFHLEEDRVKYENDRETPYYGTDGSLPTFECSSRDGFKPTEKQLENYRKETKDYFSPFKRK